EWIEILKREGYTAAYCPVSPDTEEKVIQDYSQIARENDIVISEVGAWSNPLSEDEKEREAALKKCKKGLELAEKIGARCCVNIAGSRSERWDGPDGNNFSEYTFDQIVEVVQNIIDDVQPENSFYTLEPMPWIFPDSTSSYQDLLDAVDRKQFAVHFDPVNMFCSPRRYFYKEKIIQNFISELNSEIKSCHLKDVVLRDDLTVHIEETIPGMGEIDYSFFLQELEKLAPDTPVMLEHLDGIKDRRAATNYIRVLARNLEIDL
ncbi:MAG: sugar phosphate isomerase/epimerase family protein, partial [Bacillota bacterium]